MANRHKKLTKCLCLTRLMALGIVMADLGRSVSNMDAILACSNLIGDGPSDLVKHVSMSSGRFGCHGEGALYLESTHVLHHV